MSAVVWLVFRREDCQHSYAVQTARRTCSIVCQHKLLLIVGLTHLFGPAPWLIDHPTRLIPFGTIVKVAQGEELVVLQVIILKISNSITVGRDILGTQKVLLFGPAMKWTARKIPSPANRAFLKKDASRHLLRGSNSQFSLID